MFYKNKLVLITILFMFFTNIIYTQQFTKSFDSQETNYVEVKKGSQKYYYDIVDHSIGQDTSDAKSDWEKFRSKYRFDISYIPSNANIISVKCQYVVSPSNFSYKFSVTHYKPNGTETDKESWIKIKSSPIKSNLQYSSGYFTDPDLTSIIKSEIKSDGIFYLGAFSDNESLPQTQANVVLMLEIDYEILKLTVQNNMHNWHGGNIGVGINSSSYTSRTSPYTTPVLNEGNTINLHAYENQTYNGYTYIWNDTEAPLKKSNWSKEGGESGHPVSNNTLQTTSYSVVEKDGGAKLIANLRRICNVTQKYEFTEGGISGTTNTTTQIEGNTITLTADATKTANGLTGYFSGWKEDASTSTTLTKTINEHSTFTAEYKAVARSDNANAYQNNNQRKILQTENGTMFRVYESLNKIWLEKSTNGGSTWVLANNHHPINKYLSSSSIVNKQPSIAIEPHNDVPGHFKLLVAYIISTPSDDALWIVELDANGNVKTTSSGLKYEKQLTLVSGSIGLSEPVIAINYENNICVVVKRGNDCLRTFILDGNLDIKVSLEQVPTSNSNSIHPTLSSDVLYYHLAWQQNGSEPSIKYVRMQYTYNNTYISYSHQSEPSSSPDYDENTKPSITCFEQRATVAWVNTDEDWISKQIHVRTKNSNGNWGTTTSLTEYDADADMNVSVACLSDDASDNEYILSYVDRSYSNAKVTYYLPEDNQEDYLSPNNYDDYVQVFNNEEACNTVFSTFKTDTSPNVLRASTMYNNLSKTNTENKAVKGRELILAKGLTVLKIKLEAITVDDKPINFVDINDTVAIKGKEEALSLFTTKAFNLNNESDFLFNLKSVISKRNKDEKSNSPDIDLKIVLLDAKTNQQLDVLKEVSSKNLTDEDQKGIQYKVNTKDIDNKEVKLSIKLETKNVDDIVIIKTSNLKTDDLKKAKQKELALNKELLITDYALYQNYPNPFNPTTTITYQIPEEGKVTIKVYDSIGKEITTLVNEEKQRGRYNVTFDASNLTSGIYFYSLSSGTFKETKKLILLK